MESDFQGVSSSGSLHILTLLNPTTMEALMNGHPQDAKKVTITGAGH